MYAHIFCKCFLKLLPAVSKSTRLIDVLKAVRLEPGGYELGAYAKIWGKVRGTALERPGVESGDWGRVTTKFRES
jgi:hypothetical protein